ncbi:Trypsin-like peptidase domain-containing protein [Limimaricola pyoseonensis]|uniref:Serine protease n=2 Tax=Limimaricola pyoseonensis TaxID=521013 RepID=A0A1G7LFW1_9RHOB|nr:Trypsin-like peptidase domain-containing protein [Limimaricola pyoseonensis]
MAEHYEVDASRELVSKLGISPGAELESAGLLNLANRIAHALRLSEFRRDRRLRPNLPTVVAEGDSWFLHQMITDTLDHLREEQFNVRSMAAAGDTVDKMLSSPHFVNVLRQERARIFLFSGGGNDLLGGGRIRQVLHPDTEGVPASELINNAGLEPLLENVLNGYRSMIATLATHLPAVQIFSHGYDYLGKIDKGPWIWPYLEDMGYSLERAGEAVAALLNRFNAELEQLAAGHGNFTYVRLLDVVGDNRGSWYDAIHPKAAGFGRVAKEFAEQITGFIEEAGQGPDFSEGEFAAGLGGQAGRAHRRGSALERRPNEAISWAYASRNPIDFERVRYAVNTLPPRDEWLRFRDPLVHKHIGDVIYLLGDPSRGQTREQVAARMRTRPIPMVRDAQAGQLPLYHREPITEIFDIEIELMEALFGDSEIEPIQVLLKGYKAGRAVGRVQVMNHHGMHIGHGSGFLVAPGLFLTNHHVLRDADAARRSFVVFDDETPLDGSLPDPVRFRITGDVFWASEAGDYAFCSIEPLSRDGVSLDGYGHLALIQESGKALNFEPVSIVQHPGGDPKAIAIRNSFIMGRVDDGVYYTTDTLGGSSGSPVLNREWQVVALHHRFVPHPTERGAVLANRGIRVSSIYADLYREQGSGNRQAHHILQLLLGECPAPEERAAGHSPVPRSETVCSGAYSGLSEGEFLLAIAPEDASSEYDLPLPKSLDELFSALEALPNDPASVLQRLGADGYRFIVAHEISSRAVYESSLRRPILPGAASGITIGIGYDLGYKTKAEFRAHWGDLLDEADLRRLELAIGKTRQAAAAVLPGVRNIVIPYSDAVKVFERYSLPKVFGQLNRHIPDAILAALPAPCLAALMSLTFNRGASYQKPGGRYREMRAIRSALLRGAPDEVPALIRSMKRLWEGMPNVRGLLRRRDEEAALFGSGLVESPDLGGPPAATEEWDPKPDGDEESTLRLPAAFIETGIPRLSAADVRWVNTFSNNPDYAHLPASAEGARFTLSAPILDTAIELGSYVPHFSDEGHLIVGIRGAALADGSDEQRFRESVELVEGKPDHRTFRCVLVVYHRNEQLVSAFRASTVPNRGGVASCANRLNGHGGVLANLLPTGCYELCVGTHFGTTRSIPTVLRLGTGTGPSSALKVTTLRTSNDAVYGTHDLWDPCKPMDNIHPAFSASTADFSSLGCLTLPGRFGKGQHSGIWASFRKAAGFDGAEHMGRRYNLLLTSGMELAAIAQSGAAGTGHLRRLAHGSQGEAVRSLQSALGTTVDGDFGPGTKKALVEREAAVTGGSATGIYSVSSQAVLGFGVLV